MSIILKIFIALSIIYIIFKTISPVIYFKIKASDKTFGSLLQTIDSNILTEKIIYYHNKYKLKRNLNKDFEKFTSKEKINSFINTLKNKTIKKDCENNTFIIVQADSLISSGLKKVNTRKEVNEYKSIDVLLNTRIEKDWLKEEDPIEIVCNIIYYQCLKMLNAFSEKERLKEENYKVDNIILNKNITINNKLINSNAIGKVIKSNGKQIIIQWNKFLKTKINCEYFEKMIENKTVTIK